MPADRHVRAAEEPCLVEVFADSAADLGDQNTIRIKFYARARDSIGANSTAPAAPVAIGGETAVASKKPNDSVHNASTLEVVHLAMRP